MDSGDSNSTTTFWITTTTTTTSFSFLADLYHVVDHLREEAVPGAVGWCAKKRILSELYYCILIIANVFYLDYHPHHHHHHPVVVVIIKPLIVKRTMDQEDESSNSSSSATNANATTGGVGHRPKRMAAVLSGHAPVRHESFPNTLPNYLTIYSYHKLIIKLLSISSPPRKPSTSSRAASSARVKPSSWPS